MLWRVGEGVLAPPPLSPPRPTVLGGVLSRDPDPERKEIVKVTGRHFVVIEISRG